MRIIGKLLKWALIALVALLIALRLAAWWREGSSEIPKTSTLIPTSSGRVAASISGPENGPHILLIHGSAAWSGFWRDVSAHLAAKGWRVIAVDIPPFGYSDRDPGGHYDRPTQARRFADVLRATGGPAVVLGHSFGAGSATEVALTHPELIRSLILVDAALGSLDPAVGSGKGGLSTALSFPPLGQAFIASAVTNPAMAGPMLRSFIAKKEAAAPWLATLGQPMNRAGSTSAYAQWVPELFSNNDGALSRKRGNLAAIKVPVSLIWGEADTVTPLALGKELKNLMHARQLITIPGAGHIPHIEDPAAFLSALDRSLPATTPKN
jgi:pimeloyl-ACP methyl ester carboxylesterase